MSSTGGAWRVRVAVVSMERKREGIIVQRRSDSAQGTISGG